MTDVFISYKSDEFDEANRVRITLEENGISCWMAPMSITGGASYASEIPQAIREAKIFVLILSRLCQQSKWVPRELDQAINEGKTVLPFMLENCPLKDDFSFYLSNVQRYPAYENKAAALERMIKEIRGIIGVKEQKKENAPASPEKNEAEKEKPERQKPAPKTAESAKPKKKIKPLYIIIPAAVILALLAAVFVIAAVRGSGSSAEVSETIESGASSESAAFSEAGETATPNGDNYVTAAGEKILKSEPSVILEDKELTEEDISALSEMSSLYTLYLNNCTLPEASLNALFSLASGDLELKNCGITDQALSSVNLDSATLTRLCLDDNKAITDLSVIQPLGKTLTKLEFNRCSVSDVSFLSGFTGLRTLYASENGISSLSPLSGCSELIFLDVSNNALTDLDGLETCIKIEKLFASGNRIENVNGLRNATVLTHVDLSGNNVADVSPLSKSKDTLYSADLSNNGIGSIEALTNAPELYELKISGNGISSLAPLASSTRLSLLYAAQNKITDISVLSSLTELREIDLSYNDIEKTDALANLTSDPIIRLDLSGNRIKDLVLPKARIRNLNINGNKISGLGVLYDMKIENLSFDYAESADYEALGKLACFGYKVYGCPIDKRLKVSEALGSYITEFVNEE